MIREEKIIYPCQDDYVKDNGDYILINPEYRDSVSFFEGVKGLKIPKNYLSGKLRTRFVHMDDDHTQENLYQFLERITVDISNKFEKEFAIVKNLLHEDILRSYNSYIFTYISFVLKSELFRENNRISYIIDTLQEPDDDVYYEKLKHAVAYPGETDEEWKIREAEWKKKMEVIFGSSEDNQQQADE